MSPGTSIHGDSMRFVADCIRYMRLELDTQVTRTTLSDLVSDWMKGATAWQQAGPSTTEIVSTYQPVAPIILSLQKRHRSLIVLPAAVGGRLTVVEMNPLELPVQAGR